MILEGWSLVGYLLVSLLAGGVGVAVCSAPLLGLRRRVLSLEFEIADLQDRLLREVKTRASKAGVEAKKAEEDLFSKALKAPEKPNGPWWMAHVHPDIKT